MRDSCSCVLLWVSCIVYYWYHDPWEEPISITCHCSYVPISNLILHLANTLTVSSDLQFIRGLKGGWACLCEERKFPTKLLKMVECRKYGRIYISTDKAHNRAFNLKTQDLLYIHWSKQASSIYSNAVHLYKCSCTCYMWDVYLPVHHVQPILCRLNCWDNLHLKPRW